MFTVTPPAAPAKNKDEALNALWAFVEGIGFDPAKVVEAYSSHEAYSLGLAVGMTRDSLHRVLPLNAAQLFGATSSTKL
ncbi:TPA: hypothetical protein ACUA4C_004820 [Escherichia coli]